MNALVGVVDEARAADLVAQDEIDGVAPSSYDHPFGNPASTLIEILVGGGRAQTVDHFAVVAHIDRGGEITRGNLSAFHPLAIYVNSKITIRWLPE